MIKPSCLAMGQVSLAYTTGKTLRFVVFCWGRLKNWGGSPKLGRRCLRK